MHRTSLGPLRHALGGYHEFAPPPSLARVAESVWTHRSPDTVPEGDGARHRVLPDPALSLALYCRRDERGAPLEPRMVVIGPKTRPHLFGFRPGQEIAAVRVKLEWTVPLLGLIPDEHSDSEIDLASALPRLASELLDALAGARSAAECARMLAGQIAVRAAKMSPREPASSCALDLVRTSAGKATVEGIADAMGLAPRTLRRRVRRDAGVALKEYARITRLLRAVTAADRAERPAWASIAADSGFFDQSHLVRECRALAGLAPGQVYRERRAQAETSNPR